MMQPSRHDVPDNHPLRATFRTLAERGMAQLHRPDPETVDYLAGLLTDFVHVDNMYRIENNSGVALTSVAEMFGTAAAQMTPADRREHFRHIGDVALFQLGLFPEQISYRRRPIGPDYYIAQGRKCYYIAAESDSSRGTVVLRKLSEHFEECVLGLNWVKVYTQDPFFQYMFREFRVV